MKVRMIGLVAFSVLVAVVTGDSPRRFASPTTDVLELCHRIHLLPVGSLDHARALQSCPDLHAAVPKQYHDVLSQQKITYVEQFDTEKAKHIAKAQDRVHTPQELAGLKALENAQVESRNVKLSLAANKAARGVETTKSEQQAMQDRLDQETQWRTQVHDHQKVRQYENDLQTATAAKAHEVLDVKRVEDAKQKGVDYEAKITDVKAKAANDLKVIEDYKTKIKDASEQRAKDKDQRLVDEAEAKADAQLPDDADKLARAKARDDRAKEREARASQLEKDLTEARRAREEAMDRQQMLVDEAETRAKLRGQQDDADAALVANRKRRHDEEIERQKRIDDFKKEESEIKARREEFERAEKERDARLKKRQEEDEARAKKQQEEDEQLAKALEQDTLLENRKQQDDEEECTSKEVSCGSGKCLQKKTNPKEKRCQCQENDKGKNCEHAGCTYDVADGAGKMSKRQGNMVNGQCVRWDETYRCTCDQPWRLDVKCMKKKGTQEIEVPKTDCKGLREPENEYKDQVCKLCRRKKCELCTSTSCSLNQLEVSVNETSPPPLERKLAPAPSVPTCIKAEQSCDNRMARVANAFQRPTLFDAGNDVVDVVTVASFDACEQECIKRDGASIVTTDGNLTRPLMTPKSHCTWVYAEEIVSMKMWKCSLFFTGKLPKLAENPPKRGRDGEKKNLSGFISFVIYPRRWDLYREVSTDLKYQKFCDELSMSRNYYFYAGADLARTEGEGSFAVMEIPSSGCISTADTVLENALALEEKVENVKSRVQIPNNWRTFGQLRPPASIISELSGVEWTYTVDNLFRVTEVRGISTKLHQGEREVQPFEQFFNSLNIKPYLKTRKAPFCAGHLIAYQQEPVNFYFNYVPQHRNSYTGGGAWHGAENAARSLIGLGCELDYHVHIDYDQNGELTPHQMYAKFDPWATESTSTVPDSTGAAPPKPHSSPDDTRDVYVDNKLKCHYRYRPFVMSVDFTIVNGTNHCKNLYNALTIPQAPSHLLEIEDTTIITTRIFAYLLQKQTASSGPASTWNLARVLRVATAMKKERGTAAAKLQCYMETGNIAPFTGLKMKFEFFAALLINHENNVCVKDPDSSECTKWTMIPDTQLDTLGHPVQLHYGVLITADRKKCMIENEDPLSPIKIKFGDYDTESDKCARFEYVVQEPEFTMQQVHPKLPDSNTIEDLIHGNIVFGSQRKRCLTNDMMITNDTDRCWKVRISYYTFQEKRMLAESNGEDDEGDDTVCMDCGC